MYPIEYTMTHRIGAGGQAERCQRPPSVVETADRVRRWAVQSETCQSCASLPAVTLRQGQAICSRCRENRGLSHHGTLSRSPVALRDDEGLPRQLRGLSIVFGKPSEDMGFVEYVDPAAVDRTLSEGIDVRALWNHDSSAPLGRLTAGTLRLHKASNGLMAEIDPPRWARSHVESVERRDVIGMSFAFQAVTDDWRLEDETPIRTLLDMRVYEVSGVTFPAYPDTTLRAVASGQRSDWFREEDTAHRLRMAHL